MSEMESEPPPSFFHTVGFFVSPEPEVGGIGFDMAAGFHRKLGMPDRVAIPPDWS